MAKVTLQAWAAANYDPPPKQHTLWRWARLGLIVPLPEKHGREYRVEPDARYIPADDPILGEAVHGTKSKKAREPRAA